VSPLPIGKPEPLCLLYLWGMIGVDSVELPARNIELSYCDQPGTKGSVELCPPCWLLEPHKGIELVRVSKIWPPQHAPSAYWWVAWAPQRRWRRPDGDRWHQGWFCNVDSLGACHSRTQVAGKVELGASIPTVFQGNILGNILNAVRIRRDNKDGVMHTTMLYVRT
jgi:hypothetical protein